MTLASFTRFPYNSETMIAEKIQLSRGVRKYIRKEKARIRREVLDFEEQTRRIEELYKKFSN